MKLKKGDNVIVIAGKEKGKKGKITFSFTKIFLNLRTSNDTEA